MKRPSLLTAKEIAKLTGKTKRAIQYKAKKEAWPYKEYKVRGGRIRYYWSSNLPVDVSERTGTKSQKKQSFLVKLMDYLRHGYRKCWMIASRAGE